MSEPLDAAARRRALDPARSFIVQSPAGSGKTELLVQRILALLARVDEPEEIIAVTFTRKAAGEMRQRVVGALREPGQGLPMTQELAGAAVARDRQRGWALSRHPARLRVMTIDALCMSLVQRRPLPSGLGMAAEVVDDAGELYREAARRTLATLAEPGQWSRALAELLTHQDGNWRALEDLLIDLLARRDQWLARFPAAGEASRAALEAGLARCISEHLQRLAEGFPAHLKEELLSLAVYAGGQRRRAGAREGLAALADLTEFPGADVAAAGVWRLLAELLTRDGDWRRRVAGAQGFPAPGDAADPREAELFKRRKAHMQALLAELAARPELRDDLNLVKRLPAARYSDAQWRLLGALAQVLKLALGHLLTVFAESGRVDFQQVAEAASRVLGEPERPSDLGLILDYRLRHLLVDEFQDTSRSQYQLLERLTAGWTDGDGRTLFLVGDPMQSIYGFRDADVALFGEVVRRRRLGQVAVEPVRLEVNFRSGAGLVHWFNRVFAEVFPSADPGDATAVPYAAAEPGDAVEAAARPAASVHVVTAGDSAGEAGLAVDLAAEARARGLSCAVLVRNRGHLEEIVPLLQRRRIRYQAVDVDPLNQRQPIIDLLALTQALNAPTDRVAALAVLRAPWCGLELADLERLCGAERGPLWPRLEDPQLRAGLSANGRARCERLLAVLERDRRRQARFGLRERVEWAWLELGGPACLERAADLADVERFLRRLEDFDQAGLLIDRPRLEAAAAALYAEPTGHPEQDLQLMTIHRAKGLEYDVVIVPGLGRPLPPADDRLLQWNERRNAAGGRDLLLAARSTREDSASYAYIKLRNELARRHEERRLLYVAATRARRELHLLGEVRERREAQHVKPRKNTALALLWPGVGGDAVAATASGVQHEAGRPDQTLRRLPADWSPPAAPGARLAPPGAAVGDIELPEFDWASEVIRCVGTVVHGYLETMVREGLQEWTASRIASERARIARRLEQEGLLPGQLGEAGELVRTALGNTLADPRGRWLLSAHRDGGCELALTGSLDGRVFSGIIDRTFVDECDIRWIVDYKASMHGGGDLEGFLDSEWQRYRAQLQRYGALLRRQESRPIRLALYFPLLGAWREEAFTD